MVNENWHSSCVENCYLACLPLAANDSTVMDSLFSFGLAQSLEGQLHVAYSDWVRETISSDAFARRIVSKFTYCSYSQWEILSLPSIIGHLTPYELSYLHLLLGVEYLLVPYELNIHDSGAATTGNCQFRLYDMTTGDFILVFRDEYSTVATGPRGREELVGRMVSDTGGQVSRALRSH